MNMKRGLMILIIILTSRLLTVSQNIIQDKILIDTAYIPLWYKTILQYEREKIINDTLRKRIEICNISIDTLIRENQILRQQKELLSAIIENKDKEIIAITNYDKNIIKKQRKIIKITSGTSLILLLLVIFT